MAETLKTQTVSFSSLFDDNFDQDQTAPTTRFDTLTTHQMKTIQVTPSQVTSVLDSLRVDEPNVSVQTNEQVASSVEQNTASSIQVNQPQEKQKKKRHLSEINRFYSFIPTFYLKELRNAKFSFFTCLVIFLSYLIGAGIFSALVLTKVVSGVDPYSLLLLIPFFIFSLVTLVINANRFRNFNNEAKDINFRDDKVLSTNIQRLYRRLKTSYIDINWFSALSYVLLLLTMLVDSIMVMFAIEKQRLPFADFYTAYAKGQATYIIVFYACVAFIFFILTSQITLILLNYLRATNIENFYNYMIIDANEIQTIKRKKNIRDLVIFCVIVGSIVFLIWLVFRIIRNKKQATKVIVK